MPNGMPIVRGFACALALGCAVRMPTALLVSMVIVMMLLCLGQHLNKKSTVEYTVLL
jgi:preprotein translocase subunit SecD